MLILCMSDNQIATHTDNISDHRMVMSQIKFIYYK
jgi:hypothetical protein